ncbi:kelch repeat-containing protein [Pinibacter aurantiacus]|uniref:Galactose oxidase n=1 Tax=Pinibacter aurantiacus TaxID=2851599 RepID=A0A9E2S4T9_9BACT|nr:kelch repeat-containing protein [Pinibacter aurantiacus]MBV4355911.1 hypothetical protein [Pinibacter aurantiacus]
MAFVKGYHVYFGYILRVINGKQNIDLLYDQKTLNFTVIIGEKLSGISFTLDSSALFDNWNTISLQIAPQKKQLQVFVNHKQIGSAPISFNSSYYQFLWGANDLERYQTRDLPPMRIKDIKLFDDNNLAYYWPLDEIKGDIATDRIKRETALVKNPKWVKPAYQDWTLEKTFVTKGNAICSFDKKAEILYIVSPDSVTEFNVKNIDSRWKQYAFNRTNIIIGTQGIFDPFTNKIYNILVDKKKAISYAPGNKAWDGEFRDTVLTEYWHSNKFLSPVDTSIYIIGGYGQLKYKNSVERYSIPTATWDSVHTGGDFFPPRYLAASGVNETGDTAFIIGGYGSSTGNQILDPVSYSDMYAFSVRSKTFKKLFDFKDSHTKFTFANNLIVDSKNQVYYGLLFSNDSFNSSLQLVQGSLKDPSIKLLGNKIAYPFYDIQSYSDLYYSPKAGKLIAVTFFYSNFDSPEKFTTVKVYSIDFPPQAISPGGEMDAPEPLPYKKYVWMALAVAVLAAIVFFISKRRLPQAEKQLSARENNNGREITVTSPVINGEEHTKETSLLARLAEEKKPEKSAIFLFGQFQVFDNEGKDITGLFTPLTKELFLLIITHTFKNGRGITADSLNEILWTGKSSKIAKNNLSVNLTKIKSIVEKIGNCTIEKNRDFLQFVIHDDNTAYVDYDRFMKLVGSKHSMTKSYMEEFLGLVFKGAFLNQTEYSWLDDIKAQISNQVIDICLDYLNQLKDITDDPEIVIEIANCIFYFDRLNEDALEYKCKTLIYLKRHALANQTYTKFIKEYKEIYGEDFSRSFPEISKNDPHTHLKI